VVALRAGAVPEVVVDGITGIICDRPEQLADAVRYADAISPTACRAHVARRFNLANLVSGYEKAYHHAITSHTQPTRALSRTSTGNTRRHRRTGPPHTTAPIRPASAAS
jgi:hypothetical protein